MFVAFLEQLPWCCLLPWGIRRPRPTVRGSASGHRGCENKKNNKNKKNKNKGREVVNTNNDIDIPVREPLLEPFFEPPQQQKQQQQWQKKAAKIVIF